MFPTRGLVRGIPFWAKFLIKQNLPISSLNNGLALDTALAFFFFSFGFAAGMSAKMSVSSLNKSSSLVLAFFGRFDFVGLAAANMSSSSSTCGKELNKYLFSLKLENSNSIWASPVINKIKIAVKYYNGLMQASATLLLMCWNYRILESCVKPLIYCNEVWSKWVIFSRPMKRL